MYLYNIILDIIINYLFLIHRCPWCRLLFYNDEKEYKKHITMHVDIDIMNSKSFSCPFCGSVVPPTLHAWQKHKHQQHEMHNVSSADRQLSPVAGTSHETPQQIGHGSSETNDSTLPFSFTKVREKTFKNGVKDKLYKVKGAATRENLSSGVCEQHGCRPACASAQSDQRLCYSLFGKYHMITCFRLNFNFLPSLCS